MKPREEARRDLVRQWVAKAEKDFDLSHHLAGEGYFYREAIAFSAQQAAEKFLKAFLISHQIDFPKTHNLGELLDLVSRIDTALAERLSDATALNPYGVEYRYPGDFPELTQEDAEAAFGIAQKVRAAMIAKLARFLEEPHTPE